MKACRNAIEFNRYLILVLFSSQPLGLSNLRVADGMECHREWVAGSDLLHALKTGWIDLQKQRQFLMSWDVADNYELLIHISTNAVTTSISHQATMSRFTNHEISIPV